MPQPKPQPMLGIAAEPYAITSRAERAIHHQKSRGFKRTLSSSDLIELKSPLRVSSFGKTPQASAVDEPNQLVDSRPPIPIGFVCAHLQVSFSGRISFQLGGEPLEPFESLLRTAALAFMFDVGPQFTPGETHGATHEIGDDAQRNNPRIDGVAEPLQDHTYYMRGIQHAWVRFDSRSTRTIRNAVHQHHRLHPFWSENRLNGGEGRAFLPRTSRPLCFDQAETNASNNCERRSHIRYRR